MLSPIQQQAIMQDRKRQLLQAARVHQLYRQADQERTQIGERLMNLIGDLMIAGGEKLKARRPVYYTFETENW
jgi:Na+-transporting NADH:ubiquinone oxidoreductase subunit NqrC